MDILHRIIIMLRLLFLLLLQFQSSSSIVSQILTPVSIFEESPVSTIVVDLRPTFHQLNVHPDQAVLLQSQPSQPFEYLNGRIQLKSRLDREDFVRKRLCLGGNVLECNFTLTLTVHLNQAPFNYILSQPITCHDINDMIPKFSQSEAMISTAENVPVGHRIPLEIAVDLDSPPYGIDHYRLVTSTDEDQEEFSIVYDHQSRELELIVNEKLDREKIDRYLLKLLAIDRGHTPNIGVQYLTIEISDINDSSPKFEHPIYNVTIAENTLPEYLVKLRATDADIGVNAELSFTLENDHQRLFHLDPSSGLLTLTHALDYEFHSTYQLKAQVQDHGINPLIDTCLINIYVSDQNDHAPSIQMKFNPIFESNLDGTMAYVPESFDIQLPIAFVNVYDQDSAENGKSQLTIEPNRLFYLEILRPNYYSIKSLRAFDRESTAIYQIELRARDFGQPSLRRSMNFQLNITDTNDEKPQFKSNYTFEILENNQIPSVIGEVRAEDADLGLNSQILYSLVSPSSIFSISPIDGIISTNVSFDYETQREYFLQVRARDSGQPPLESISTVRVNILNQNEYPPQFAKKIYTFSVDENSTEQCLGQVKAVDRDFGDRIEYQLDNYQQAFTIDEYGKICTKMVFDREMQDQYNLTVIAKDSSMMSSTMVIVRINDINDNYPIFIWPDTNEIRHVLAMDHSQRRDPQNPSAQFITDLVVRDDDIGNNSLIRLSLTNEEYFYIGSNHSLWLRNTSILPGTYQIEIYADNLQLRTKKMYHILIFDRHALKLNLFQNMSGTFSRFSLLIIVIISFLATGSTVFLLVYYLYIRLHYLETDPKRLYGSRLIVNDEEKSKGITADNHDYAMIIKPKKTGSSPPSGNSSSTTTDGEFSSSLLSCPINGPASSIMDLRNGTSSTVSALTTLTRKSHRRPSTKNVTFQTNLFDDFFSNHSSSCDHEPTSISSTFSTLPKSLKRDGKGDLPSLNSSMHHSSTNPLPQPPPLLDGIRLLDQMLTKTTTDDRTSTSSNSHSGWYNVTSPYQTRASVV